MLRNHLSKVWVSCTLFCILLPLHSQAQLISFEDVSEQAGILTSEGAHGIAVADYNNDGWDDLFIAAENGGSVLLRNQQDGTFEDVTAISGLPMDGDVLVPLWGDVNNDGYLDVFIGKQSGETTCYVLLGSADGVFADITEFSSIQIENEIGSASFGDYNLDGRIDLFIATRGSEDYLFENVYDGGTSYFDDVSARAGIEGDSVALPMQATWVDYDNDFDLDLFAVHDGNRKSRFYQNHSFLPLIEVSSSSGLQVARSSMGVAWGDYNNDGWPDAYITNIDQGNLFKNMGNGRFQDVTLESGAGLNGMSWGVVFVDFDNDGDEDLFIGNTYDFDGRRSFLYENVDGVFRNIAREAGVSLATNTFGVATGDFNNDGLMDLVVGDDDGGNKLLLNQSEGNNNWVQLEIEGDEFNRMAVGAKVQLYVGEHIYTRSLYAGSSYRSQVSPTLHIGLSTAKEIDSLYIHWGKDATEILYGLDVNKRYTLVQNNPLRVGVEQNDLSAALDQVKVALFPSPFSAETTFTISITEPSLIQLAIYDITGREIERVIHEVLPAGIHRVPFFSRTYPAGMYFYRLISKDVVKTGSIVIVN